MERDASSLAHGYFHTDDDAHISPAAGVCSANVYLGIPEGGGGHDPARWRLDAPVHATFESDVQSAIPVLRGLSTRVVPLWGASTVRVCHFDADFSAESIPSFFGDYDRASTEARVGLAGC